MEGSWFWSNGYSWGTINIIDSESGGYDIELLVIEGSIKIKKFILNETGKVGFEKPLKISAGETHKFFIKR